MELYGIYSDFVSAKIFYDIIDGVEVTSSVPCEVTGCMGEGKEKTKNYSRTSVLVQGEKWNKVRAEEAG